jgi:uncharacterized membrane protein HdeD (DUF308 family)
MTIVFWTQQPLQDLSLLISGSVMVIAAILVIYKVYNVSKNTFAYTLMSLTIILGISNIGVAVTEAMRKEVMVQGRPHYFFNQYFYFTCNYLYFMSSAL